METPEKRIFSNYRKRKVKIHRPGAIQFYCADGSFTAETQSSQRFFMAFLCVLRVSVVKYHCLELNNPVHLPAS